VSKLSKKDRKRVKYWQKEYRKALSANYGQKHLDWIKQKEIQAREEPLKLAKYPNDKILDYPFIREEDGSVNLDISDTNNPEKKAKMKFLNWSFLMLSDAKLVDNDIREFEKMDYDDILSLIKTVDVENPEARLETKLIYFSDNKQFDKSFSKANSFLKKKSINTMELLRENKSDISFGRWVLNGIHKAINFIQSFKL